MGRLKVEALREEVHRFDRVDHTPIMDRANVLNAVRRQRYAVSPPMRMVARFPLKDHLAAIECAMCVCKIKSWGEAS